MRIAGAFLVGGLCGWKAAYITIDSARIQESGHALRAESAKFPLIQPLLACSIDGQRSAAVYEPLNDVLMDAINRLIAAGDLETAGIYIRDLSSGSWTSVHGDDQFVPASLLKIVTAMAYLHEADEDTNLLQQVIRVDPATTAAAQNITPKQSAIVGEEYTVQQLLELMIVYSDNIASRALLEHINPENLSAIMQALEIPPLTENDEDKYTISPRLYSRFLRILYNGTLLSREYSEQLLEWLAASEYQEALVQGVRDRAITVAHKFGETTVINADGSTSYQHHDCGIVYRESPYAVCIMTQGKDLSTLAKAIASFTSTIDDFMTKQSW